MVPGGGSPRLDPVLRGVGRAAFPRPRALFPSKGRLSENPVHRALAGPSLLGDFGGRVRQALLLHPTTGLADPPIQETLGLGGPLLFRGNL